MTELSAAGQCFSCHSLSGVYTLICLLTQFTQDWTGAELLDILEYQMVLTLLSSFVTAPILGQ
jgi:hypothetical protein